MGVEWTSNKSQHKKLTLRKKILSLLLPGVKQPFHHESSALPTSYPCSSHIILDDSVLNHTFLSAKGYSHVYLHSSPCVSLQSEVIILWYYKHSVCLFGFLLFLLFLLLGRGVGYPCVCAYSHGVGCA